MIGTGAAPTDYRLHGPARSQSHGGREHYGYESHGSLPLARLNGASESEVARAKEEVANEMRDRVRAFNNWICETHEQNNRIIPYVMMDPVLFGSGLIDELERCIPLGARA